MHKNEDFEKKFKKLLNHEFFDLESNADADPKYSHLLGLIKQYLIKQMTHMKETHDNFVNIENMDHSPPADLLAQRLIKWRKNDDEIYKEGEELEKIVKTNFKDLADLVLPSLIKSQKSITEIRDMIEEMEKLNKIRNQALGKSDV